MMTRIVYLLLITGLILAARNVPAGTLQEVRDRGFIICGVHSSLPGFAVQTRQGWQGLEVDLCRAVAAATLGDAQRVRFQPLGTEQGYRALQSGELDILVRHNDWQMLADTALGLTFVAPWFYREQGFLIRTDSGGSQVQAPTANKVCRYPGTNLEGSLPDPHAEKLNFPSFGIALKAFQNGLCNLLGGELIQLQISADNLPERTSFKVIKQDVSPSPTGPWVRQQDSEWFKIVRWTVNWLLAAEQLEIAQDNIAAITPAHSAYAPLQQAGASGISLGLHDDWPTQVILQLGHYGEIFARHFNDYEIDRASNRLAEDGGLQVAPRIN